MSQPLHFIVVMNDIDFFNKYQKQSENQIQNIINSIKDGGFFFLRMQVW